MKSIVEVSSHVHGAEERGRLLTTHVRTLQIAMMLLNPFPPLTILSRFVEPALLMVSFTISIPSRKVHTLPPRQIFAKAHAKQRTSHQKKAENGYDHFRMHFSFVGDKDGLLRVELLTQQFNIRVKDVTVTLHDNLVYLLLINVVLVSEMTKSLFRILMQQARLDL